MKIVELEQTDLHTAVTDAQQEQVVVMRNGSPVAVILSTMDWDHEQLLLAQDNAFWQLITARRAQQTISRAELERRINDVE